MDNVKHEEIKPFYKLWWFWLMLVAIIALTMLLTLKFLAPSCEDSVSGGFEVGAPQGGPGDMSDEDREQMREKFDNLSDEEREEMMNNRPDDGGGMPPAQMQN